MIKYIFWLSFFSGIGSLAGLPYQSLNIAAIPALFYLIKNLSSKKLSLDCLILILIIALHTCISLYYLSLDSIVSLMQLATVVLVYISLRISNFYPSSKGVFNLIFLNLLIGFFQSFGGLGFRGVPMIESEPSRSARSLLVLLLPITLDLKRFRKFFPPISLMFIGFLILNRSASLILVFAYFMIILFQYFFDLLILSWKGVFKIKKLYLSFVAIITTALAFSLSFGREVRAVSALVSAFKYLSSSSGLETLILLMQLSGRRLQSVFQIYTQGIFDLPRGVQGYNYFLNKEALSNSMFSMTHYHLGKLSDTGNFEPFSYSAALIAQGGFLSFLLIIIFSATVLFQLRFNLRLCRFRQINLLKLEIYACTSAIIISVLQLWFYSTDSIIQHWILLAIAINYLEIKSHEVEPT